MPKDAAGYEPAPQAGVRATSSQRGKPAQPSPVAGAEQAVTNEKKALASGEESPG